MHTKGVFSPIRTFIDYVFLINLNQFIMADFSIDLHCHPGLHPYAKSFTTDNPGENTSNRSKKNSIWYYDSPTIGDRAIQRTLCISKYSQSDLTTLAYGNVKCICASLCCIERGFVNLNGLGDSDAANFLVNLIGSLGKERIDFLQQTKTILPILRMNINSTCS